MIRAKLTQFAHEDSQMPRCDLIKVQSPLLFAWKLFDVGFELKQTYGERSQQATLMKECSN